MEFGEFDVTVHMQFHKYLMHYSKPHLHLVILNIFFIILMPICNVAVSNFLREIIDLSMVAQIQDLRNYIVKGIVLLIVGIISTYLASFTSQKFGAVILRDVREDIIKHYKKLPVSYLENNHTGDMISKLTNDADVIQRFFQEHYANLIYVPIMLVVLFSYMAYLNILLFVASIITLPILIFISVKYMQPVKKQSREYLKYLGKINNIICESISGIGVVKAYNLENVLTEKFNNRQKIATDMAMKNDRVQYKIEPVSQLIYTLPEVIAYILGGYLCITGVISWGELIAFVIILKIAIQPCSMYYLIIIGLKVAIESSERLFTILEQPVEEWGGEEFVPNFETAIKFEDVSFSYDGKNNILKNINFSISSGMKIAFVGESGCGKSTLLNLINGFYETTDGYIYMFNKKIKDYDEKSFVDNISYVSQNTFLFPVTIFENIQIGKENATLDEVINAAKLANAHEFICSMTEGYQTILGERGTMLSGGQIQRICIARAILKNSPIIIFDEATSALDIESEKQIQIATENLGKDKTVLVVAHRLSTIKNLDVIFVLKEGTIVEIGNHDELLEKQGHYAKLYSGGNFI